MENEHNDRKLESIYSKRLRAGKRRTYFFDVRSTKGNDYYLTITESRKRFDDNGYDRHKVFLYKEDFNKFIKALNEAVDYVKTELMPDFNFDAFNHEDYDEDGVSEGNHQKAAVSAEPVPITLPEEQPAPAVITSEIEEKVTEATDPGPSDNTASSQGHEEVEKW